MTGTIAHGKWKPIWLNPSLGPKKRQNTIRVDHQAKSTYSYKYAYCRENRTPMIVRRYSRIDSFVTNERMKLDVYLP